MTRVAGAAVALLVIIGTSNCGGGKSDLEEAGNAPPGGDEVVDIDAPKRAPLTADQLAPVVRELGPGGVVPTSIIVNFAMPIIERDEVGRVTAKSQIKITPPITGALRYETVSQLRFVPTQPLAFDTDYQVELIKVETRDGVISAPSGGWKRAFHTPKFAMLGIHAVDPLVSKFEVEFSGAVLPVMAYDAMTFTVDGVALPKDRVVLPQRAIAAASHRVPVQLGPIKRGARVEVELAAGLTSIAGTTAPAAKATAGGQGEPVVAIYGGQFVEGANGYYLEVACFDSSSERKSDAYREDGQAHPTSSRCILTDDSVPRVSFDPPVAKTYVSAGRQGFRVFGDFRRGVYNVKIDAGARTVDGGLVAAPFTHSYAVSARKPQLSFIGSGRYLPRKAWNNLGFKHLNVDEVNLVVRQVPPENLVFWLGNEQSDAADDRTSNVILNKRIALRGTPDVSATSWQDLSTLLPASTKGILQLKLAGVGVTATSRILLTDLSLVAKKTAVPDKPWRQTVRVWAMELASSSLLDDVEVSLVRKSGKVVARCKTTGDEGCTLDSGDPKDPDHSEPFALIAKRGDDFTYIRYQDLRTDVVDSNTSGQPYQAAAPYRAATYADRGVYRPGETAHVVAIVRDAKDRAPGQPLPVDIKIVDSRSKVVRKFTATTNAAGVVVVDHALPAFAPTGRWNVQFAVADKGLAAEGIQVEEFVPERMAVTIQPKASDLLAGSKATFDVSARYLFGGSALDSGVLLDCSVAPSPFFAAENDDYSYGVELTSRKPVKLAEARTQLDPKGAAVVDCGGAAEDTAFTHTAALTATASVLEAGSGRATVKTTTVTLHPEKFYIGLKTKTPVVSSGKPFTVDGIIVDWRGKLVTDAVTSLDVELGHLEADFGYGYDEESGEARYDRTLRTVPEGRQKVAVTGGRFTIAVTPGQADSGYAVKVSAGKARSELRLDGLYPYEYYSEYFENDRLDQTPRPGKPTKLKVELASEIKVGAPVTVKAIAPYRGKVLWTVETDRVVAAQWRDTDGGAVNWQFTLDQFAPNVYVTAFVVKDPHLESRDAFLPDRAYGVASARVVASHATHEVKVTVPDTVRSSAPLAVTLELPASQEPTFATIAVVDEGILSLTGFATPNPINQLFPKRALAVETYETIGWTMPHQPAGVSSKTGGGDEDHDAVLDGKDEGGGGRVQPVKPVALFSGIVEVPASGKLVVPFQLPTFRGKLRVMAVTASATKVGRAEAKVVVRDPLVVQVTFPRFVTRGDEVQIPVMLTNMSGQKMAVSVKLDSENIAVPGITAKPGQSAPLQFTGKDVGAAQLDNGFSDTLVFAVKVQAAAGGAKLRVVATAGSLVVKDEVEVPLLPAGPHERAIQTVKLAAGKLDLTKLPALQNWEPTSDTTTLWVTNNPYGEAFEHLSYLLHYPYGCIEQTTSATRPLLYLGALAEQLDPHFGTLALQDMVLAGIHRVLSMQTPAGGFGYWPGATEPEDWSTAYATHMLLDAKAAGYPVPEDRLKEVLAWIDSRAAVYERGLGRYDRHAYQYYDGQVEAYFHYVLARAGKGKAARIQALIAKVPATAKDEQLEDQYMLKAALYLAGNHQYASDLKRVDASPLAAKRVNSWTFYSDRRRRGMQLAIFFDLFKNDPAGEPLAQRVAQGLTGQASGWYTTQELVWGITGLGKWVSGAVKGTGDATLTGDGVAIAARATKQKSVDKSWTLRGAANYRELVLDVPASAAGMYLVARSEGVRPGQQYKVGGSGLAIKRSYRDRNGTKIDLAQGTLKLGELAYVELELANTTGDMIQNIALVDRLPAGFEIENPRLGRGIALDWLDNDEVWAVDFQNMRDDRLEAFGALAPGQKRRIVYTVRAVTAGKFALPPVEAEAMYDPTQWARDGGGTAVIGGPWTGKTL